MRLGGKRKDPVLREEASSPKKRGGKKAIEGIILTPEGTKRCGVYFMIRAGYVSTTLFFSN